MAGVGKIFSQLTGRQGCFVGTAKLEPGKRIYAIGDIHGRLDLLKDIVSRIKVDLAERPVANHQVVTLGDYCDRGPDGKGVYDLLIKLAREQDWLCLRGNHDQYILEALANPADVIWHWLRYGGVETLLSYGIETIDPDDPFLISKALQKALPAGHRRFIENMAYCHNAGDYFFCHAGVRPGVNINQQDPHDLMWIRQDFLLHKGDLGKVVVHGHTPGRAVDFQKNRINVDTGAYESGVLSCLVLENDEQRVIDTSG